MVIVEGKHYKSCLIDTCVWSELSEDIEAYNGFNAFLSTHNCAAGFSIYTVNELLKVRSKYNTLLENIKLRPAFLTKPLEMLINDELKHYPNDIPQESIVLISSPTLSKFLDYLTTNEKFQNTSKYLDTDKPIVLKSILDQRKNFPPKKNGKYTTDQIIEFIGRIVIQQLESRNSDWFRVSTANNSVIAVDKIKSLISQLLITFWKFYLMEARKPKISDIVDISISSSLPYVDFILTEKNLANDIKQVKRKGLCFDNLEILTINDLKAYA